MKKTIVPQVLNQTNVAGYISSEERYNREEAVYDYFIWGYTFYEIYSFVTSGGPSKQDIGLKWDISEKTCRKYLQAAKSRRKTIILKTQTQLLNESKERWQSIILLAKRVGNLENIRLCQKELDRLNGLERITIDINVNDLNKKTDEELMAELTAIELNEREQGTEQ